MSYAVLSAAAAGVCAAYVIYELVASFNPRAAVALARRLSVPLVRAGSEGREPTVSERYRLSVCAAAVLFAAGILVSGLKTALLLAVIAPIATFVTFKVRQARFRTALAADAPLLARALADALRGGHSIRGAIGEAAGSMSGEIGVELAQAQAALELGETTDRVLERLGRRASCPEFDSLVAAMLLQRDAGGDLSALLLGLARSLEETVQVRRDARAATAQARFTATTVLLLPLLSSVAIEVASPGYLASLIERPISAALLAISAVLQLTGVVLVRRISRVMA